MKSNTESHINRIIGQLERLKQDTNQEQVDCEKVVQQLKAIIGSTRSLGKSIARTEIEKCLTQQKDTKELYNQLQIFLDASF